MGPNRIPRRDWLLGTSASLVTLAAASAGNAAALATTRQRQLHPRSHKPASEAEDADRVRRMKWWHEARFGMFVHWGLYSVLGRHEWVMEEEGIPVSEYELLAKRFQPQPNAARAWAKLAKTAGQKYMVMTTKHHEGFCNFDTKLTNYCAPKQGPGRDLAREYRGSGASRRPARRLLLFADGLASSGWRALRHGSGSAQTLRRIHPRPHPRTDDQLRKNRCALVRRGLAAYR